MHLAVVVINRSSTWGRIAPVAMIVVLIAVILGLAMFVRRNKAVGVVAAVVTLVVALAVFVPTGGSATTHAEPRPSGIAKPSPWRRPRLVLSGPQFGPIVSLTTA